MSEVVKTLPIRLSCDCNAAVVEDFVDFLKSRHRNIVIIVNPIQEQPDDEELVNIRDTDFWKNTTPGDLLLGTRLKYGLSQKQLSKLSGISHATISAYEHNRRPLSKQAAIRLAKAMDEPADCFFKNLVDSR